ncbi:hypothetical protein CU097_004870 [Rhizopus azygosporus]|uniref:Uncharacterized protein n=2 Tax=Rhizopus TaxID=4842 RepID=A0A367JD96_RHIAZ|nr:hypothetical protein BCV71DRAFT_63215 [Rhizopus microsporus]RCH87691.1 hypothetical protein CU097_004870 [Rhizopus azygosporus]
MKHQQQPHQQFMWLPRLLAKNMYSISIICSALFILLFIWHLPQQQVEQTIKHDKPINRDYYYSNLEQSSLLVTIQNRHQFISFHPLLCRFQHYPVHLVLLPNGDLSQQKAQDVLSATNCQHVDNIVIHDLTTKTEEALFELIKTERTKVVIRSSASRDHLLEAFVDKHEITMITLPEQDINHALWIPDLSIDSLQNWNKVDIKLVIITDRRPHSLSRLLQSALRSVYFGDRVDLNVHMEQSADRVTRMLVNSFMWKQGAKQIRHRIKKGGLMPAIVESWYPSHDDEYAVLLEDDIEVSPYFYAWSKYAILKYRYGRNREAYRLMYGVSLYAPRNLELLPAGRVTFDPNSVLLPRYPPQMPYLSQVPCSWGAVYFPEHWREFHGYLVRRLEDLNLPKNSTARVISVPGSRSDKWKKSWKKYFIELVYLRAYVMLYPNFHQFEAFSTNHVEVGTHFKSDGKRQSVIGTFMVPLMQRDTILSQLPDHRLPFFEELPVLDLWGRLQTHESLDRVAAEYHEHVSTCARTVGSFDPKDIFCRVDGPPDPPQVFPGAAKKPKLPVLVKEAVQPIEYNYKPTYTKEEAERGRTLLFELGPKPIDVAQLTPAEDKSVGRDDEMIDLENDLDTLNRIYYKMNPQNLDFLNDEQEQMEEEEEEEEESFDDQDEVEDDLQIVEE